MITNTISLQPIVEEHHMLHETILPTMNGRTGPEKLHRVTQLTQELSIWDMIDPYGSFRFVMIAQNFGPVGALQCVQRMGRALPDNPPIASNLYVIPSRRKQGIATALMKHAIANFPDLVLSQYRTPEGQAWIDALRRKVEPFQRVGDYHG